MAAALIAKYAKIAFMHFSGFSFNICGTEGKKAGDLRNFRKFEKCSVSLLPSCNCHDFVGSRPSAAAHRTRGQASGPVHSRRAVCRQFAGGPDAHATSCVCGAARSSRFPCAKVALTYRRVQHSRGPPPHRLTRSQKTKNSAEIRVLRSAALPSTAVSRALARNAPSC